MEKKLSRSRDERNRKMGHMKSFQFSVWLSKLVMWQSLGETVRTVGYLKERIVWVKMQCIFSVHKLSCERRDSHHYTHILPLRCSLNVVTTNNTSRPSSSWSSADIFFTMACIAYHTRQTSQTVDFWISCGLGVRREGDVVIVRHWSRLNPYSQWPCY